MDFRILGALEICVDGRLLRVSGPLRRALLAVLLVRANRVVPVDRLLDVLWDSAPPPTATTSLQVMIHRLRASLGGDRDRLVTHPSGYQLKVAHGELDLHLFDPLAVQARTLLTQQRYQEAARAAREALALWRGPALADTATVRYLRDESARLDQRRIDVLEDRVEADLALGRSAELTGELADLAAEYPGRERLHGQLMQVLYRCGRPGDALAVYRALRRRLVDELGVEPGPALQRLHARILAGDSDLQAETNAPQQDPGTPGDSRPDSPRLPAQLPHDVAGFAGRTHDLTDIEAVARTDTSGRHDNPIIVLDGMAGVGKSALAIHIAHRFAPHHPDGQLFVDLHGFDPTVAPTPPGQALGQLLRGLGVPTADVPAAVEEQAALYRSLLSGKQILLVLDNAYNVEQVRPLLPGGAHTLTLIPSRTRLDGLIAHDGARQVTITGLPAPDGRTLLERIVGEQRIAAEPDASAQLVEACGNLPLALRIAAARLSTHPYLTVGELVHELAASPLDTLRTDDDEQKAARIAFATTYERLPADTRRLFRLLGAAPATDLTVVMANALAGADPTATARHLDRLCAAHLAEQHAAGRYRQHNLIRRYAVERAAQEDQQRDLDEAVARLYRHQLRAARAAARLLRPAAMNTEPATPRFRDVSHAVEWFESERRNLVGAACHAAEHGQARLGWQLASALSPLFLLRHHAHDWIVTGRSALAGAVRAADRRGIAEMHLILGNAYLISGDTVNAREHYEQALTHHAEAGWLAGHAAAAANFGVLLASTGHPHAALHHYQDALALQRRLGNRHGQAIMLDNIGGVYFSLGQLTEATRYHHSAIRLHREARSAGGQALAHANLGNALREAGRLGEAEHHCRQAITIFRDIRSTTGLAQALCCLADVCADGGDHPAARVAASEALDIAQETGEQRTLAEALNILACLDTGDGRHEVAGTRHLDALLAAARVGHDVELSESLLGLAEVYRRQGHLDVALACARRALHLVRSTDHRISTAAALITLGSIHLDRGARRVAADRLREAARVARDAGQEPRCNQAAVLLRGLL